VGDYSRYEGTEESTYLHLSFKPRKIRATEDPKNIPIRANRSVQVYFSTLKKSNGEPSKKTYYALMTAARRFLEFHRIKATDHALDDLIDAKVRNPNDPTAEQMISLFRAKFGDQATCPILGLYHRNFADVKIHISIKSGKKTIPLTEPQLLSIYNDSALSEEHRLLIDSMAYSGERIAAIGLTTPKEIHFIEGTNSALIEIEACLNKTDISHPSIVPRDLAERILENVQVRGYSNLFPNHKSLFQHITWVARERHSVRFTSHYLRKRFQTIGETTSADDMSPNEWTILMGDKPKFGHIPDIYSLIEQHKIVDDYEQFLAPRLKLGERFTKPESTNQKLERENIELRERLDRLLSIIEGKLKVV
jgi:hypothetical protein